MTMRLALRALVAVLISASTFIGLGAAVAAGEPASDQLPSNIEVPVARMGDAVSYDATLVGAWDFPSEVTTNAVRFSWSEGEPLRALDGFVYDTDRLDLESRHWGQDISLEEGPLGFVKHMSNASLRMAAGLDVVVAQSDQSQHEFPTSTSVGIAGNDLPLGSGQINFTGRALFLGGEAYPNLCLASNALQGVVLAPGDHLVFSQRACSLFGVVHWSGNRTSPRDPTTLNVTVVGMEWKNGHAAAVLEAEADQFGVQGGGGETVALRLWMTAQLPYPLAVQVTTTQGSLEMTLSGWNPGTTPRVVRQPVGEVPVALVQRPSWTIVDDGVLLAWPLSQAYATASTDPLSPLPEFLAANPEAYVSQARPRDNAWDLHVSGTKDTIQFSMTRLVCTTPPLCLGTSVAYGQAVTEKRVAPAPDVMPAQTMSLASWRDALLSYHVGSEPAQYALTLDVECDWLLMTMEGLCEPVIQLALEARNQSASSTGVNPGPPPELQQDRQEFLSALQHFGPYVLFMQAEQSQQTTHGVMPATLPPVAEGTESEPKALGALFVPASPLKAGGVTAAAIVAGLLYWLWPALKGGLLGLFSRQLPGQSTAHPQRARILQLVEAQPGIHHNELRRVLQLGNGTLAHHLAVLTKDGQVHGVAAGGYTCYYPGLPLRGQSPASALKSAGAQRVFEAIQASPGASNLQVAQATGLDPGTVHHHVQRLVASGLVRATRIGRQVALQATAQGAA